MSVTSRILVDMIQFGIPIDFITGVIVLHAEKYVPLPYFFLILYD